MSKRVDARTWTVGGGLLSDNPGIRTTERKPQGTGNKTNHASKLKSNSLDHKYCNKKRTSRN